MAHCFDLDEVTPFSVRLDLVAVHLLAILTFCVIIWHIYNLSRRAVLSWAAWTNFYPLGPLFLGPLQHCTEVSVEMIDDEDWPHLKRILGRLSDMLGKFQFLAGTAVLAGLALVSGRNAVKVLAVYGVVAIVMRECATWTLEALDLTSA